MPLYNAIVNTTCQVWRRQSEGAGGDAVRTLVHRGLKGHYEAVSRQVRDIGGREVLTAGVVLLPAFVGTGYKQLDVEAGDELRFTDYRGREISGEVVEAKPVHVLQMLDHIVVVIA